MTTTMSQLVTANRLPEGPCCVFVDGILDKALSTFKCVANGGEIVIEAGTVLDLPLQLLFVTNTANAQTTPRLKIRLGAQAQVTLVESHVGAAGVEYSTQAECDVELSSGARLTHILLQEESLNARHTMTTNVRVDRNAHYASCHLATGGITAERTLNVALAGEGAECALRGLYLGRGTQRLEQNLTVTHEVPHCTSLQHYRGILDDNAVGSFVGTVVVKENAIKTQAQQLNKNLLLSSNATANTCPRLNILADDVKCSHGATVGQLNDESLFYLRSRGLGMAESRALLTLAFANEVLADLPSQTIVQLMRLRAQRWLGSEALSAGTSVGAK